jgi:hypothetical protein
MSQNQAMRNRHSMCQSKKTMLLHDMMNNVLMGICVEDSENGELFGKGGLASYRWEIRS